MHPRRRVPKPGQFGLTLTWTFKVPCTDEDGEPAVAELTALTGDIFKRGWKARKWADALAGPFEKNEPIDLAMLVGPCRVTIVQVASDKDVDDIYNRIVAVNPPPPKRRKAVPAPASPEGDEALRLRARRSGPSSQPSPPRPRPPPSRTASKRKSASSHARRVDDSRLGRGLCRTWLAPLPSHREGARLQRLAAAATTDPALLNRWWPRDDVGGTSRWSLASLRLSSTSRPSTARPRRPHEAKPPAALDAGRRHWRRRPARLVRPTGIAARAGCSSTVSTSASSSRSAARPRLPVGHRTAVPLASAPAGHGPDRSARMAARARRAPGTAV